MIYEKMWNELKKRIESLKNYYNKGEWCSLAESAHGEASCDEVLSIIKKIEHKEELFNILRGIDSNDSLEDEEIWDSIKELDDSEIIELIGKLNEV